MLIVSYYIIFFVWSLCFFFLEIIKRFLVQGKTNTYILKKSFYQLSFITQLYLIFFYNLQRDPKKYKVLLKDYYIIIFLRKTTTIQSFKLLRIFAKKLWYRSIFFSTRRTLFKNANNTKFLRHSWKSIIFLLNLDENYQFLNWYILSLFIEKQRYTNFEKFSFGSLYYNFFMALNRSAVRKNKDILFLLSSKNKLVNPQSADVYVYNYQLQKILRIVSLDNKFNLKFFVQINEFCKRIFVNFTLSSYWRWFFKYSNTVLCSINKTFKVQISNIWPVRYLSTSFSKYETMQTLSAIKVYFLRKNKIFNKSRYSRNRQLYRTGVYWCLWLSIFLGWSLYFIFYRYTLNFGHLWWIVYLGLSLFFFVKAFKYRFYNPTIIWREVESICFFLHLFVQSTVYWLNISVRTFLKFMYLNNEVLSYIDHWWFNAIIRYTNI